jgi:hypothetical protein
LKVGDGKKNKMDTETVLENIYQNQIKDKD